MKLYCNSCNTSFPINIYFFKCPFYKCRDQEQLKVVQDNYRLKLCKYRRQLCCDRETDAGCPDKDCQFAHDIDQLDRSFVNRYKSEDICQICGIISRKSGYSPEELAFATRLRKNFGKQSLKKG
jgi:hypothetical protein